MARPKACVRLILLFMILLNVAFRYPMTNGLPLGSDTFVTMDLSRSLAEAGQADWILTSRSYIGLFPISYPSGTIFLDSELEILSEVSWNSIPWIAGTLFSILMVLGGFILLRALGIRDDYAAMFSGIMSLSPLFLFFTYGQVTPRGCIMPILTLAVSQLFLSRSGATGRFSVFVLLTIGAMTMHRTSYVLLLIGVMWFTISLLIPLRFVMRDRVKKMAYLASLAFGFVAILGPFLPTVRSLFGEVSDISASYRLAEWEFGTGFLFTGGSPLELMGNLAANYTGSVGIVIVLFPLIFVILYPRSRVDSHHRLFLLALFLVFSPFAWNAQYSQIVLLPFFYVVGATVIQRRRELTGFFRVMNPVKGVRGFRFTTSKAWGTRMIAVFFALSLLLSSFVFYNRTVTSENIGGEKSEPSYCTANLGIYIRASDSFDHESFVSNSGLLDRRVRWISGWSSPVSDPTTLLAHGYLELDAEDFTFAPDSEIGVIEYLSSFYKPDKFYRLDVDSPYYRLTYLSWVDIYGFLRLYFLDSSYAVGPRISTSEANISIVIEALELGDAIGPMFALDSILPSLFLSEVSSEAYTLYKDGEFRAFLAAEPVWS